MGGTGYQPVFGGNLPPNYGASRESPSIQREEPRISRMSRVSQPRRHWMQECVSFVERT